MLRAIAAIMVVIFHAQALLSAYELRIGLSPTALNMTNSLRTLGSSGVDIFFVISGFVMAYISYGKRGSPSCIAPFLKRRLIRIVPIYWMYTFILAALLLFLPQVFATAKFSAVETLLSCLFIPYNPLTNPTAPVLQVGWTLSYEMYFYLLVGLGLCLSFWRFALLLGVIFSVCVAGGLLYSFSDPGIRLLTNPILFEFLAGFICGGAYLSGFTPNNKIPPALFGLGIIGYVACGAELISIPPGFFAVLLVAGSVFWEQQAKKACFSKILVAIGNSSYTLYLSHYLLMPLLGKLCAAMGFWHIFPSGAFIIFATITCVLVAHVLYMAIEMPLMKMFRTKHQNTSGSA